VADQRRQMAATHRKGVQFPPETPFINASVAESR